MKFFILYCTEMIKLENSSLSSEMTIDGSRTVDRFDTFTRILNKMTQ
jgi:hypothetical protein